MVNICTRTMTFGVIFVDRLVMVVSQIVSRRTRKYPNPSNERSERMSTQTLEFWSHFMPPEKMVMQAMSQ